MTIPTRGIRVLLTVLFVAAVVVRVGDTSGQQYPYFKNESATNYHHVSMIAETGSLPPANIKSGWPEGYPPSRVGPTGVEYLVGFAYRLNELVSDRSLRDFIGLFSILFFSLSVVALYLLTSRLWNCQAAGLFAAFLVAFSPALVRLTNGREFFHGPFAFVFVAFHLALLASFLRQRSSRVPIVSAALAFALLGCWEGAGLYLALFALGLVYLPGLDPAGRKIMLLAHVVVVVIAAFVLPHLRAERFVADWPAILTMVCAVYVVVADRLPARLPRFAYLLLGTAPVVLVLTPLRAGAIDMPTVWGYWAMRIRHLAGRPEDAKALSDAARYVWTNARTFPRAYESFQFFLPLAFFIGPAIAGIRRMVPHRPPLRLLVGAVLLGSGAFLIDKGAVFVAALVWYPLVSAAFFDMSRHIRSRGLPVAIGFALIFSQVLFPYGNANATYLIGKHLGATPEEPDGFMWVSIGNADFELVRYLVSRTSVRDVFFIPPEMSSLLVAFAGRTSVLASGVDTGEMIERTTRWLAKYYEGEEALYEECRAKGVEYVLYSIDLVLDTSRYSPQYLAGGGRPDPNTAAYRMHFRPETLRHFNLQYQNDNFRLFRVTDEMEPIFQTDHPPVYQESILERYGDSLESFHRRIIDILLTYHTAIRAQTAGDDDAAIRRLRYCLEQAPRFTRAWAGVGNSYLNLRNYEAANAAYRRALEVAPENDRAMYYFALTSAHLGRTDEAIGFLDVLIKSTQDRELLGLARELQAVLKSGIPLDRNGG